MLLKKQKIIGLEILRSTWTRESVIMEKRKIPLVRMHKDCKKCELDRFCSLWGPNFTFHGLDKIKKHKVGNSVLSEHIKICNCNPKEGCVYQYIFTYDILRRYVPIPILTEMGLYIEPPKITKKPKNYYDFPIDGKGRSNKLWKNNKSVLNQGLKAKNFNSRRR